MPSKGNHHKHGDNHHQKSGHVAHDGHQQRHNTYRQPASGQVVRNEGPHSSVCAGAVVVNHSSHGGNTSRPRQEAFNARLDYEKDRFFRHGAGPIAPTTTSTFASHQGQSQKEHTHHAHRAHQPHR